MKGSVSVFVKDLLELLASARAILLVVILPTLVMVLVGQLRIQPPTFRMLVAGTPATTDSPRSTPLLNDVIRLLNEIARLDVVTQRDAALDPLAALTTGGFDLLLNIGDAGTDRWTLYTAETEPARLRPLQDLVTGIERALELVRHPPATVVNSPPPPRLPGDSPPAASEPDSEAGKEAVMLVKQLEAAGAFPVRSLFVYYPRAASRSDSLLTMVIALIVCFLPFVLAAPSIIEEKQQHTFEVLLVAPNIDGRSLLAGKSLLPVGVALFNFSIMLIIAQTVYHIDVKVRVLSMMAFLLPALLSSTFLGLTVSSLATSQSQALMASAVYFLMLALFTGLLTPIGEASVGIQAFSKLFPLTFVYPSLTAWVFGVPNVPGLLHASLWLVAQAAFYLLITIVAYRRAARFV
jgi:ABC-type multidrug transport system permease subunit